MMVGSFRIFTLGLVAGLVSVSSLNANADPVAEGAVIEFEGPLGALIVARDGIVRPLNLGDDLYSGDILRTSKKATIVFRSCVFELPDLEDVELDDEFCSMASIDDSGPTLAEASSEALSQPEALAVTGNAPLIVGGVVLSAGGIGTIVGGSGGSSSNTTNANQAASQGTTASSP